MEKIDLNNYEAYFLDYMEGSLSAEEKHDLFVFLEKHPHLQEELDLDISEMELMPTAVTFDAKESLKMDADHLMITEGTVDELMIAAVEDQLTTTQKSQLEDYVKANNLTKSYAYTQATKLKADLSIQFDEKESLKQKTGVVISMTWVTRVASIAAVGAILVMIGLNWGDSKNNTLPVGLAEQDIKSHNRLDYKTRDINTNDVVFEEQLMANEETPNYVSPQRQINPQPIPDETPDLFVADKPDPKMDQNDEEKDKESIPLSPLEEEDPNEDIADAPKEKTNELKELVNPDENNETIASYEEHVANKKTKEEPYRLITNAASDIINREVRFTREKDNATADYVAYSFKLGKFEFERKKAK